jgi:hypothetical protein
MQRGGVVLAAWHRTIALNIQINAAVFRLSSATPFNLIKIEFARWLADPAASAARKNPTI